jgi:Zn-dependent M28 family amino/carboxypeptidase
VVFAAFTGEEIGLVGSQYYVNSPAVPMEKTVAMINLDMVGRLRDEKVMVGGAGSGSSFGGLLDDLNRRYGFQLTKSAAGFGASDQLPFYGRKVPVMHFVTGLHSDYHRPTDTWEKLNLAGMRRIAGMVTELVVALATAKEPPQYVPPGPLSKLLPSPFPFSRGMDIEPGVN